MRFIVVRANDRWMSFPASRSMEYGCTGMRTECHEMECAYVCFGYVPTTEESKKKKTELMKKKKTKTLPYLHKIAYLSSVSSHCNFYHATKDIIKKKEKKKRRMERRKLFVVTSHNHDLLTVVFT